jgi:hypothetical protein
VVAAPVLADGSTTGRDGGQDAYGAGQGSYEVTFARPVGARSATERADRSTTRHKASHTQSQTRPAAEQAQSRISVTPRLHDAGMRISTLFRKSTATPACCADRLEHCHGTLVLHADGTVECDEQAVCGADDTLHDLWVTCDELRCGCLGDEAPITALLLAA